MVGEFKFMSIRSEFLSNQIRKLCFDFLDLLNLPCPPGASFPSKLVPTKFISSLCSKPSKPFPTSSFITSPLIIPYAPAPFKACQKASSTVGASAAFAWTVGASAASAWTVGAFTASAWTIGASATSAWSVCVFVASATKKLTR